MENNLNMKDRSRNRFVITAVVLGTFFLIMMGIGAAILGDGDTPAINQEWKEILLLVLGAFLGSYSRIIDFWFNGNDTNMNGVQDNFEPQPGGSNLCEKCGENTTEEDW